MRWNDQKGIMDYLSQLIETNLETEAIVQFSCQSVFLFVAEGKVDRIA